MGYKRILELSNTLLSGINDSKGSKQSNSYSWAEFHFTRIQRLHFGVLTSVLGEQKCDSISKLKSGRDWLASHYKLCIQKPANPDAALGDSLAMREARWLVTSDNRMVGQVEMSRMTPIQISRLEPAPGNSFISPKQPGDYHSSFLSEMQNQIRAHDVKYSQFDFNYAKRVFYLRKVGDSGSNPKLLARDRFGLTWQIKFGDEVHSDVAMSHLFVDIYGMATDIKFYSGPGESILILEPSSKGNAKGITDLTKFSKAMTANYKYNIRKNILQSPVLRDSNGIIVGSGIVDNEMAERESIDSQFVGACFLLFKECQVSLFNPAIKRLGAASLSDVGALEDRAIRSSIIFNTWVKNSDMKDDNSRVALLANPATGKYDRFVEYQCDIGHSLGNSFNSGNLNSFEKSFVMSDKKRIVLKMRTPYIPESWKKCTWSDARWMALRICKLTRNDIERSFADSGWPAFIQKVAVERLINRRNELIKPFNLDADGVLPLRCDPDFDFYCKTPQGIDQPVIKGKININSKILKHLENTVHSEGLARPSDKSFLHVIIP